MFWLCDLVANSTVDFVFFGIGIFYPKHVLIIKETACLGSGVESTLVQLYFNAESNIKLQALSTYLVNKTIVVIVVLVDHEMSI